MRDSDGDSFLLVAVGLRRFAPSHMLLGSGAGRYPTPDGPATLPNYDLLNMTDMVDGEGAGVTSVSWMVLPSSLRTKVFSRATLPARV